MLALLLFAPLSVISPASAQTESEKAMEQLCLSYAQRPPDVSVVGDWQVRVNGGVLLQSPLMRAGVNSAAKVFAMEPATLALAQAGSRARGCASVGQLYRFGIPYNTTLLVNMVNHPDARGMGFFADALMGLFPLN